MAFGTGPTRHRLQPFDSSVWWKVVASLNVPRRSRVFVAITLLGAALASPAHALEDEQKRANESGLERANESGLEPLASPPDLVVPSLHALGLMTVMRLSEAYLWPHPFAETNPHVLAQHYQAAFTRRPRWNTELPLFEADGDRWQINVIGHGLFGSELYMRARSCHLPVWQALLFTGVASATWEYVVEANGVRPSALDLTFTPLSGLLLGEARYQGFRSSRSLSGPLRVALGVLFDPFGELERSLGAGC